MARNFLSIIAGLISSFIVIFAVEIIGRILHPVPVDISNTEEFKNYVHNEAPKAFHLLILSGYAIGSFIGGFVTAKISQQQKIVRAMTVGGILMGLGVYNLITIQHPSWVIVSSFFTFLPFAYMGARIAKNSAHKKQVSH